MKIPMLVSLAAVAFMSSASAQDSVFAEPPASRTGGLTDPSTPALGDLMLLAQLRHMKVWFAGRSNNWTLLNHEAAALQATLIRSALLYQGIPIEEVNRIGKPLAAIIEASAERNAAKFQAAYSELNAACNSCHKAGAVDYIRIQTPSSSPFADQAYPATP